METLLELEEHEAYGRGFFINMADASSFGHQDFKDKFVLIFHSLTSFQQVIHIENNVESTVPLAIDLESAIIFYCL